MRNEDDQLKIKTIFANAVVSKTDGFRYIKAPKTEEAVSLTETLREECYAVNSVCDLGEEIEIQMNSVLLNTLQKDSKFGPLKQLVDEKLEQQYRFNDLGMNQ